MTEESLYIVDNFRMETAEGRVAEPSDVADVPRRLPETSAVGVTTRSLGKNGAYELRVAQGGRGVSSAVLASVAQHGGEPGSHVVRAAGGLSPSVSNGTSPIRDRADRSKQQRGRARAHRSAPSTVDESPAADATALSTGPMRARPIPGTTASVRKWDYEDVVALYRRRHVLRHCGMEVLSDDGRSVFVAFRHPPVLDDVFFALLKRCPHVLRELSDADGHGLVAGTGRSGGGSVLDVLGVAQAVAARIAPSDLYASLTTRTLKQLSSRWQAGDVSNFEYLMALNALAGRTFSDLTQYPVRPTWC